MHPAPFIAVDWGTTNRRAYRIDSNGKVVDRFEDALGVLSVYAGGFPTAVATIVDRLGDAPLLLAGMVGSNRGWTEVPYVGVPADMRTLHGGLRYENGANAALVPGVCIDAGDRADVMRGEEVQALGAIAGGMVDPDALICHPGTHAKWIVMTSGAIVDFATAMTGELFALLRDHSILAPQMTGDVVAGAAFLDGVAVALAGAPLLDSLFSVRSRMLMGRLSDADAASFASGIVIGSDVAAHGGCATGTVALIGAPALTALYAAALESAGTTALIVDGSAAFVAGMVALNRMIDR